MSENEDQNVEAPEKVEEGNVSPSRPRMDESRDRSDSRSGKPGNESPSPSPAPGRERSQPPAPAAKPEKPAGSEPTSS